MTRSSLDVEKVTKILQTTVNTYAPCPLGSQDAPHGPLQASLFLQTPSAHHTAVFIMLHNKLVTYLYTKPRGWMKVLSSSF